MTEVLPLAEIVHAIPGRARLRISGRRGDSVFFAAVATGLSTISGVRKVDIRPLTGSILIEHTQPLTQLGTAAQEARLFLLENAPPASPPICAIPIDPKIAIAAGLGLFALWQLAQGRVFPPAITLGWYAASLGGLLSSSDLSEGGE
jgi:hypothetical protein